jgi:H+-transporting ATPase
MRVDESPDPGPPVAIVPDGLSSQEAGRGFQQCGPNTVAEERPHRWRALLSKLWAPVPGMLGAASALA